jgi:hypothetical protein
MKIASIEDSSCMTYYLTSRSYARPRRYLAFCEARFWYHQTWLSPFNGVHNAMIRPQNIPSKLWENAMRIDYVSSSEVIRSLRGDTNKSRERPHGKGSSRRDAAMCAFATSAKSRTVYQRQHTWVFDGIGNRLHMTGPYLTFWLLRVRVYLR